MKKRKTNKKRIVIIFLFIILVFSLFYFFINDNMSNNALTSSLKDITASISSVTSFSKNESYNKELIKEINNDYKKEINNLKETLNLNSTNTNKEFINATVIKRSTNYWYNIITIDKGKKDNLKTGLAVINNRGLIGKIIKVNQNSSDIKLLVSLNSENSISVSFNYDNNDYYGLLTKYNYKNNELILSNVIGDFDKEKIQNINVTTSGLTDSFTSGILVGKIKSIKKDTFGISNIIKIEPSVNFDNIDVVTILKGDKK